MTIDAKLVLIVLIVGAVAGSVGSWIVSQMAPPANDAKLVTAVKTLDARLSLMEAQVLLVPVLEPGEERQLSDSAPEQSSVVADEGSALRPVFGRPDVIALLNADVDPEIRRAKASSLLASPTTSTRFIGILTLAKLGDPSVIDAVGEFIDHPGVDKRMAAAAVDLLGNIEGSSVDARLYEYLNNENRQVQVAAARQLEAHGDNNPMAQIVNEIGVSLTDDDSGVRSRAAQELGRTKSARAVGPLAAALRDESSEVRLRSAKSLGMTGSLNAIAALTAALEDPVAAVRSAADRSLDRIRNPGAASHWSERIREP